MDEVLPQMPAAWIYFVSFILIATFVAMNFFVGVIVNNLQAVEIKERDDIAEIRKALARVEAQLQSSRDAEASEERSKTDQRHLETRPRRLLKNPRMPRCKFRKIARSQAPA
jgi:Ion transport protein